MKKQPEPLTLTPIDEIRQFVAGEKALVAALTAATRRVTTAEGELDTARRALAEAQSARLVQNPDADLDGECPESTDFISASLRLEEARAALGGVRRRLADRDADLLSVDEKLKAVRQDYNQTTIESFLNDNRFVMDTYAAFLRRAAALEAALGESIAALHQLPESGDWHEDPDAVATHDTHSELRELAASLDQYRRDAGHRLWLREQARRFRAGFDPSGKYECIRPFVARGRPFQVGERVDAHDLPLDLLGRVYEARRLKLLEPSTQWEDA